MFNSDTKSIFEDNDEFGIQQYRENFEALYDMNKVKVKLIKHNDSESDYLQGDYLGIKTKTFSDKTIFIDINLYSSAPEEAEKSRDGYDTSGKIIYTAYVPYHVDITQKDLIEFISDFGYNIKAGQQFHIQFKEFGLYQNQYCFKSFELTSIN